MSTAGVMRQTALRAGGACVRCRKGKTKCVYENGRAPCRNCAKGLHECYLPSESNAHLHGQVPSRAAQPHRPTRESLPGSNTPDSRTAIQGTTPTRGGVGVVNPEKLSPELAQECERVISKTFPACVAFHKPTFIQQLKNYSLEYSLVYALLCCGSRSSTTLVRRYGGQGGATAAADHFATKAMARIGESLDHPSLADIQALCLIIIHEWGSRNAVRAYIYLGQAARMLQMHRILNSHHPQSEADFLKEESFRRTLWLLYIIDCILASTPGRFPALSPQDIVGESLPCTDMNFAFGNAVFVKTLHLQNPRNMPQGMQTGEIGEFGHIVQATTIWRDVVSMLTTTNIDTFNEPTCFQLINDVERLRGSLPMQFIDKPGQINLHITMGSGTTYAMIHCLLHCATIFVHRRRLLQVVTAPGFDLDAWRTSSQCHEIIDHLMTACHGTTSLLMALEAGSDKDSMMCYPIFLLFATFTSSATVAYLSLKGLTPPNSIETAANIVKDGIHFMEENVETWPLIQTWLRHLGVMQRVLHNDSNPVGGPIPSAVSAVAASPSIRDDAVSNADTNPDAMEYDQHASAPVPPHVAASDSNRGDSEPPVVPRRSGVTTINGGSGGIATPAAGTPPPGVEIKRSDSPATSDKADVQIVRSVPPPPAPSQPTDMTAAELCTAFERQLLELDDLAAFMGGGV